MTPSALRDTAIDRAEQRYLEALAESALVCAKAIDAAEEVRRQSDLRATNERRLAIARIHDDYNLAIERRAKAMTDQPTPQRRAEDFLIETVSGSRNGRKERLIKMYETQDALVAALEYCLREHGGFTIAGECERQVRAALALATSGETRGIDEPGLVSP